MSACCGADVAAWGRGGGCALPKPIWIVQGQLDLKVRMSAAIRAAADPHSEPPPARSGAFCIYTAGTGCPFIDTSPRFGTQLWSPLATPVPPDGTNPGERRGAAQTLCTTACDGLSRPPQSSCGEDTYNAVVIHI
jgi:hypothetical protein